MSVLTCNTHVTNYCVQLYTHTGVFPKWSVPFTEFREFDNHGSMNWDQFKDSVSYMCLAGTVVASWSLTQEVAGWQVQALLQ